MIPIALMALGFGYRLEIIIVAVACFWPLLILSRAAVRGIEARLIEVSLAQRLVKPQRFGRKGVGQARDPTLGAERQSLKGDIIETGEQYETFAKRVDAAPSGSPAL